MTQLIEKARDCKAHLEKLARPLADRSKSGSLSGFPPRYAFGGTNASKAEQVIPEATKLIRALQSSDFEAARAAAQEIETLFPE